MDSNPRERCRGALVGLAAGDALGAPVEGLLGGHIQQLYGKIENFVDPEVSARLKVNRYRLRALYTDETQQALALADTLLKCRGFDGAYFAKLLLRLADATTGSPRGAHRGTGKNFRAALQALRDGKAPLEAGPPTAGLGAMRRVAPVGLYFGEDVDGLIKAAIEQGLITNRDPRSLVMAATLAGAVALAAGGKWDKSKPAERMNDLIDLAGAAEKKVERDYVHLIPVAAMDRFGLALSGLKLLPGLLELPERSMVQKQILAEANRQFPEHKITEPNQGFVMAAGLTALYLGVTGSDVGDAVREAVRLGKDADSVGAMVGALMGARLGEGAIPKQWCKELVNAEQVALRGEALLDRDGQGLGLKDLVGMETELTKKEEQAREAFIRKLETRGEMPARPAPSKKPAPPPPDEEIDPSVARDRRNKKHKPTREKLPWKK